MQIHLLCIISIHSYIIPVVSVIYVVFKFSCLASSSFGLFPLLLLLYVQFKLWFPRFSTLLPSLLDFFHFSCFFMSNSSSGFRDFLLCLLLFWTFSASLASLCPIQALVSCFPRLASFSFGLFSLFPLHYIQFNL